MQYISWSAWRSLELRWLKLLVKEVSLATHTLGLNSLWSRELNHWRLWVPLCIALTWSELNNCGRFNGNICEQPALVCHGLQLACMREKWLHKVLLTMPMEQQTVTNSAVFHGLCTTTKQNQPCSLKLVPRQYRISAHPPLLLHFPANV